MNRRLATSRLLAGLQAGTAGALVMLGWLTLASVWSHHSIWWFPNLMATTFGGDAALQNRFARFSLSGLALHLAQFSVLGALFGRSIPRRFSHPQVFISGMIFSLAYYYLMYGMMWQRVNPLIPLYSPDRQILLGHILYGLMLARLPDYWSASVPATEYKG